MLFNENFNYLENKKIKLLIIDKNKGSESVITFYYYAIILKETNAEIGCASLSK